MRTFLYFATAALVLTAAVPAYASCNTSNPSDPENDCDNDGCPIGIGNVWDCNDSPDGGAKQHTDTCPSPKPEFPNTEACDNIDNNCNGSTDEGDPGGGGECTVTTNFGICKPGIWHCQGGVVRCIANIAPGTVTETCNGADDDCDDDVDEQGAKGSAKLTMACYSGPGGTNNVGLCHGATLTCTAGSFPAGCPGEVVPTNPPAQPEVGAGLCDNLDNDCDGTRDDGNPGGGAACSTGLFGVCAAGTLQCQGVAGVMCQQTTASSSEICDGRDNDCDDDIDEQGAKGSQKLVTSCYTGPPGTSGVGACHSGQMACNAVAGSGSSSYTTCGVCGALATCTTQQLPVDEVCDTVDNDCSGSLNNGNPGGGGACNSSNPGICRPGTQICNNGGTYTCTSTITPGTVAETCNGLDDDCDNQTDEQSNGQKIVRSCYDGPGGTSGVGICRSGQQACNTPDGGTVSYTACSACGGLATCSTQVVPESAPTSSELLCDGRNENCANGTDDGFGVGGACTGPGVGRCGTGTRACKVGDPSTTQCNLLSAIAERCNNIDDDCDGHLNNGDPDGGVSCTVGGLQGVCNVSVRHCNTANDAGVLQCLQTVFPTPDTTCNGIDENCDGTIDNQVPGLGQPCEVPGGMGECLNGRLTCSGNQALCVAINTPQPEICDNRDNNCDGFTDNNVPAQKCFTGPAGSFIGTCPGPNCFPIGPYCTAGTQTCGAGGMFGACMNQVLPKTETCGPEDFDCDGFANNGLTVDVDRDGVLACGTCNAPGAGSCDCNDAADGGALVYPGRLESCNGVDDNCNSNVDEGSGPNGKISRNCYNGPANTQGKGTCVAGTQECNASPGGSESYGACVGQVVPTNPPDGGEVTCNGLDDDCDGVKDDGFDVDNDTFVTCAACAFAADAGLCDCNDGDFAIKPGAVEICDTVDQNCNSRLDDVPPRRCFSDPAGMIPAPDTYTGTCPGSMCTPNLECTAGTQTCSVAGAWAVCGNGALGNLKLPSAELCDGKDNDCNGSVDDANFDVDGDTYKSCVSCASQPNCDCNDNDPLVHPGQPEICDNIDNDCNGTVDGANTACYSGPANTRGLGICKDGTQVCSMGTGSGACVGEVTPVLMADGGVPMYVDGGVGFNDPEADCNGFDDDCDGIVDDGFDKDSDGQTTCQGDCDDTDPFNKVGAPEICDCRDNNCDTQVDDGNACYGAPCHDFDHDGFTNCAGDCDDTSGTGNAINPGKTEVVGDSVDNDCDGAIDEDTDEDGDGYSTGQGDCNDRQRTVNPGALEICDGFDNNCNNQIDEGFDADHDGVSSCAGDCNDQDSKINPVLNEICANSKDDNCDGRVDEDTDVDNDGVSTCQGDCNDFNSRVHGAFGPTAAADEVCDGQDNDCDRSTDEGFDTDNDGVSACFGDCDDTDNTINPQAIETPGNGKDDNCDGQIDEGMIDRDSDGFTPNCGDCNDSDPTVNPHSKEVCDRFDNNCDGYVDSAKGVYNLCSVCFDADGDGQTNCDGDCNDADKAIYRGAAEICDGKDNDCDGMIDLDPASGLKVCREGEDGGSGADGGTDAGVDAGTVVDAGPGTSADAGPGKVKDVVVTGCGCNSSEGLAPLALLGLAFMATRRRKAAVAVKHLASVLPLALVLLLVACPTSLQTPGEDGGPGDESDGGGGGGGGGGGVDGGKVDAGPLIPNWPCPGIDPVFQAEVTVPGTLMVFAYPEAYNDLPNTVSVVDAGSAVVFDDVTHDIAVAILVRELPAPVNANDPAVLDEIASREIAALDNLQGTPLVRARTERFSKVFDDDRGSKNFSSSQDLSFATPTNAFSVRNRLLANFSNKSPASLGMLPVGENPSPDTDMTVSVFFRLSTTQVFIGFAVTPLSKYKANQSAISDLTNGSHLSGANGHVEYACEPRTTPALKTDFIFVMDNTPSTVIWHAALENASASLFNAFELSGLDFRVGVVTTDSDILRGKGFTANLDDFRAALQVGLAGNTNEMGIEYGLRAVQLAKLHTDPDRRLREGAGLVVLFMSDEDNHGTESVTNYVTQYKAESAVAFSIVGPRPLGCTKVGYAQALPGNQYIALANQTGGSSGSICNENVTEVIEEIVIGALGASSRSSLVKRPISNSLAIRSDMKAITRSRSNGFDYEPGNNSILFFGPAAPKVGAAYDAAYAFFQYIQ